MVSYLFCKGIPSCDSILNSKKINAFPRYIKTIYRNNNNKKLLANLQVISERPFLYMFPRLLISIAKNIHTAVIQKLFFFLKVNKHWSPCAHFMVGVTWWHSWPHRSGMSPSVSHTVSCKFCVIRMKSENKFSGENNKKLAIFSQNCLGCIV